MKVYVGSCTSHARTWLEIANEWRLNTGHRMICSWPDMVVGGLGEGEYLAKVFWQLDVKEVQDADVVLIYAESDDILRGALVEVGVALASEIPVVVVGSSNSYGTWQYHPLVHRVPALANVVPFLDLLEKQLG